MRPSTPQCPRRALQFALFRSRRQLCSHCDGVCSCFTDGAEKCSHLSNSADMRRERIYSMRDSIIITITTSGVQSHLILWNQNIHFLGVSRVNLRLDPNIHHDRFRLVPKEYPLSLKRFSVVQRLKAHLVFYGHCP